MISEKSSPASEETAVVTLEDPTERGEDNSGTKSTEDVPPENVYETPKSRTHSTKRPSETTVAGDYFYLLQLKYLQYLNVKKKHFF